ncbi:hypothetical protein BK022_00140 [Methylorubrum extorquens]|uniref:Uncharacterized protein n=1 Tax=Methylorubrum extorquens TaxID=408 RepID=A0A1S1PEB1_METEX|nr:hypothetical protein BK022_00140 [Methylorubrum extorquens]
MPRDLTLSEILIVASSCKIVNSYPEATTAQGPKTAAPLDRAAEGAIAAWDELASKAVPWMCVRARMVQIRRF